MNFFELFGLPVAFEIDIGKLSLTYKTLAQVTHPDKFANAGNAEKLMMVQKSAQVNDGYQVLKNPISRAEHILELRGIELRHEQQTIQDPEFLMQQMEWREQLEDAAQAADPEKVLLELDADIGGYSKAHTVRLSELIMLNSKESDQEAADELRKLKFLTKLHKEIELQEDRLLDV